MLVVTEVANMFVEASWQWSSDPQSVGQFILRVAKPVSAQIHEPVSDPKREPMKNLLTPL